MTVCIAAACKEGDDFRIVICTDMLTSSDIGTSDSMLKVRVLSHGFRCLTAGENADILATVALLRPQFSKASEVDDSNVATLVRAALSERKNHKIDELVRSRYGFSYDELLKIGKQSLPAEELQDVFARISRIDVEAGMIVVGFEHDTFPLIVETDDRCKVSLREDFAVVGSGSFLATAALLQREHVDVDPIEGAIYAVFEAKVYAERVASVGKRTRLSILYPDGSERTLNQSGMTFLRQQYMELGPKEIPAGLPIKDSMFFKSIPSSKLKKPSRSS